MAIKKATIYGPMLKVIIEKSRGGKYYGTGIEIWAGFGPVGITEKKNHFGQL